MDAGLGDTGGGGNFDGGAPDSGTPDTGEAATQPVLVVDVLDLSFEAFGSRAVGSYAVARAAGALPETGCVRYAGAEPALPNFGQLALGGLEKQSFLCASGSVGLPELRCLADPAGPPPISGSTIDTGPWFGASTPSVSVDGGDDLGAVTATLTPTAELELLQPTELTGAGTEAMVVEWTPVGDLNVHIEVELSLPDMSAGLVICRPDADGRVVIPAEVLGARPIRLLAARYRSVEIEDGDDRSLTFRTLRGELIHRF